MTKDELIGENIQLRDRIQMLCVTLELIAAQDTYGYPADKYAMIVLDVTKWWRNEEEK